MQATQVQIKNYHLLFSNKKNPVKRGLNKVCKRKD